jgi:hypothetical protein
MDRAHRAAPVVLAVAALASVFVLLAWDAYPNVFPADVHNLLGALPLALIGLAYLVYQIIRRPGYAEVFKATLLAIAFFFWAANQFWPDTAWATLLNDLAIWLFVLDIFFVIVGWPVSSGDGAFGEIHTAPGAGKSREQERPT